MTERPTALPPVTEGRQIVERQQLLVREGGVNTAEAIKLLTLFEATQAIFEDDLDRLLRQESDRDGQLD